MNPDHLLQLAQRIMDEAEGRARIARIARTARARRRAERAVRRAAHRDPPRSRVQPRGLDGQDSEMPLDGHAAQGEASDDAARELQTGRSCDPAPAAPRPAPHDQRPSGRP